MSDARTGPYFTVQPDFFTSGAETPGAPSWGRTRVRCVTTWSSRTAAMRRTSSAVPKVPFPAAHQTLIPLVSRTRIHASVPSRFCRRVSKLSL